MRYLKIAEQQFGRQDLAIESYHMGIGNLHQVLADYDGGRAVPYAQLYFDSAPTRHAAAYRLLASFGDDSWTYYWRVLAAVQIMHLWRTDRVALNRLNALQIADDAGGSVLHPHVTPFADPGRAGRGLPEPRHRAAAVQRRRRWGSWSTRPWARARKAVGAPAVAVPRPATRGAALPHRARRAGPPGLRGQGARCASQSDGAPTSGSRTRPAVSDPLAATGWSFSVERRYASRAQAAAFQAILDRLQSLNLIAWAREPDVIRDHGGLRRGVLAAPGG